MRFFSKTTLNKTCPTAIITSDKDRIQRDTSSFSKLLRCVKNRHLQLSQLYLDSTDSNRRDTGRTYSTPPATALIQLSQSLNKNPSPKPAMKAKESNASFTFANSTQLQNMAKRLNFNPRSLHNDPLTSSSSNPPNSSPKVKPLECKR
jgi:hypothetical protein